MGTQNFGHANRHEFKNAGGRVKAAFSDRGFSDYRTYMRLVELFEKVPALNAALVLADASGGAGPNAAAFAAFAAANVSFEHLGTNTEVFSFANIFDFGGGIKMATATASLDSAIVLPSLITSQTAWAVARQWASDRSPHFETVVTPTPAAQITTVALTTNVALITTGAAHGLAPGESVTIALDKSDSDYAASSSLEGTWVVTAVPTTTTFNFAYTHADVSSASIAGSFRCVTSQVSGSAGIAITNISSDGTTVTVTVSGKHGWGLNVVTLTVDQTSAAYIAATGAQKALVLAIQGQQTITSAYSASATTFTFLKTSTAITSAAYTGTATEVALNAQVTKTEIWAGFKKTNTPVVATDDDQCFFKYDCTVSPFWYLITSRAGVDISTPLPVVVEMGVSYRLEIAIDANRVPLARINGVQMPIDTSAAALTAGIDFIPYVGVKSNGVVPAAKAITCALISCNRLQAA